MENTFEGSGAGPAIFLVAGEASGDLKGAALAQAMRAANPRLRRIGRGVPDGGRRHRPPGGDGHGAGVGP